MPFYPDAYKISFPPITAIAQPLKEIGTQSVKVLLDEINGKKRKRELRKITLKTNFVIRKSSGG
jgi:DNA-binding LacI/PurR family transcriptional regulator